MSNETEKEEVKNEENKNPQNQTLITVAIIGLVGTILTALIGILPNVLPKQSDIPTSIVNPTNTMVSPTTITAIETPILPTETQFPTTPTPPGYYDDFKEDANWLPISTPASNERGIVTRYIADGVYHWDVQTFDNHAFSTVIEDIKINKDLKISNFEYEVTFQKVEMSNPDSGNYGIQFRKNSSLFYVFYISNNNGSYGLDKYSYTDQEYYPTVTETLYPGINKNGNNTLKVITQGESIHLYINGVLVERVLDKLSPAGSFALYSWLPDPDDSIKMEISHLSIIPLNSSSSLDTWPTQLTDVQTAELQLSDVDDEMTIWVNGQEIITSKYHDAPAWASFSNYLIDGDNIIEVSIRNGEAGQDCSGQLRLKLNGIINSGYQWYWEKDEAPANAECFHEKVTLSLK